MLKKAAAFLLALHLLSGCAPKTPAPTINESMTKVMSVQAQTIWDITSHAFNDKGDGLDATKLTPTDWTQLEQASQAMKDRALLIAQTPHVVVAGPDAAIMGGFAAPPGTTKKTWDAASATQIQALIDADPKTFGQRAQNLADAMDALNKATQARDAATVYKVSAGLDDLCDGCHKTFWGTDEPPPFPKKK